MLDWYLNDRYENPEQYLGPIPEWISDNLPAWEQLEGWNPFPPESGFSIDEDYRLHKAGMEPLAPAAYAMNGLERVVIYPAGFVAIVQLNGSFSLSRLIKG